MPDPGLEFETKPGLILSHFYGHESEGSIFFALKSRGWIHSLSASVSDEYINFSMLELSIQLTEEGLGLKFSRLC